MKPLPDPLLHQFQKSGRAFRPATLQKRKKILRKEIIR